ncbi:hypothetical protein ACT3UQ_08835 [Glutamicibacter sp. AOP12-B1-11]|uniref:hypothetical protein n=1 Tax=Glutamicibacter sp. AOP12-B1-11 TaxID=3457725 RepID=UPI004033C2C5
MANITRSASMTVTGKLTVTEMQEFLNGVPDGAEISFNEQRGDRRDPRESGYRATTIKATWTEPTA